jgi:hypothetical protein
MSLTAGLFYQFRKSIKALKMFAVIAEPGIIVRTSIFLGRVASGSLKQFFRPSSPVLGELGNRN